MVEKKEVEAFMEGEVATEAVRFDQLNQLKMYMDECTRLRH